MKACMRPSTVYRATTTLASNKNLWEDMLSNNSWRKSKAAPGEVCRIILIRRLRLTKLHPPPLPEAMVPRVRIQITARLLYHHQKKITMKPINNLKRGNRSPAKKIMTKRSSSSNSSSSREEEHHHHNQNQLKTVAVQTIKHHQHNNRFLRTTIQLTQTTV